MSTPNLQAALAGWRNLLGEINVVTEPTALAAAATATFATDRSVPAIVRPGCCEEVQACLKIANDFYVTIYPVSRGKNWGFGSRVPAADACVILDLGRMNRILDYDPKLATITVEPGVTFRQAYAFLKEQQASLMVTVIGGSPDASLIGNVVERGDGAGPLGDRAASVCALEIVLPNGHVIHTGFGRFAGARTAPVDRWGLGPALDGLFSQSNLGVVTRMTLWLMPLPEYFQSFGFSIPNLSRLPELAAAAQRLLFRGILRENCLFLWNSYKVLMVRGRYPWTATQGRTPLDLRARGLNEPWYGSGALNSGSSAIGRAERAEIESALAGLVDGLAFRDPESRASLDEEGTFVGIPTDQNVAAMYWRKRMLLPAAIDGDRDRCGVIWLCPGFPLDGTLMAEVIAELESITHAHQLEPSIGLHFVSARYVRAYLMLTYDRDVAGEDERARTCHDRLLECIVRHGCHPYRVGLPAMNQLPESCDDYAQTLQAIKHAIDPNGILAPGRYDFRRSRLPGSSP